MAAQVYIVLYTHQKTKKIKLWHDGLLKTSGGKQAVLYSDKGQHLDSVYLKTELVSPGDELESDRYLITVEAVGENISSSKSSTEIKEVQNREAFKPIGLRPPASLKRKFLGFQGPREITKKPSLEPEESATLLSSPLANGRFSQAPQLYTTSPLFAAVYGKQADKDEQVNCSNLTAITAKNANVGAFSNFSASPEHTETINGERIVEQQTKPNPRSTAQILALLNIFPSPEGSAAGQLSAGVSNVSSNEVPKTTLMRNAPGDAKPRKLPNVLSDVIANPIKSRWEVYLDNVPASGTSHDNPDDDLLLLSPGKRLDASWESDRKMDIVEKTPLLDSRVTEYDLKNSLPPTPETMAVDTDDIMVADDNTHGPFSEISFNLMDSFDFTQLDDTDSKESGKESASDLVKEGSDCNEKQGFIQKGSQENNEHNTDCGVSASEFPFDKAHSEGITQPLLKGQSTKAKTEVMTESKNILIVGKGEFLLPAERGHISSSTVKFQSDDMSNQMELPKNQDELFGYFTDDSSHRLPNANIPNTVRGSDEDCNSPKVLPSVCSISLFRSLIEPSSALESLNGYSVNSPATTKNTESGVQTQREEEQVSHRFSQGAALEGYQARPLFIAKSFSTIGTTISASQLTNHPVVTEGHSVKGSVCSAVVIRRSNPVLDCFTSLDSSQYSQSSSSFISSPARLLGNNMRASTKTSQDNAIIDVKVSPLQSRSRHSPASPDATSKQNILTQWTQGSECDLELSQWSPSKFNKMKTPVQNQTEGVCRFTLRPRQSNSVENMLTKMHESTTSLDQNDFSDSTKIHKVQSRIMKESIAISVPENEVNDITFNTTNALEPSTLLLRNSRNSGVSSELQSSKWTVYQSACSGNFLEENKEDSDFCPQSVFRRKNEINAIPNIDVEATASPNISTLKDKLGYPSNADCGSRDQILTKILTPSECLKHFKGIKCSFSQETRDEQDLLSCELGFPCSKTVLSSSVPKRKVNIPTFFKSRAHYKQVFSACLSEHLNIVMYDLSQRLHKAYSKVNMSFYTSNGDEEHMKQNAAPFCQHKQPAKLVMTKKEGPNKGRFFYACDAPKGSQCKFFKWLNEVKGTNTDINHKETRLVMADMKSLSSYVRCHNINLYEESQLIIRKLSTFPQRQYGRLKNVANVASDFCNSKTRLYLKLSRKDISSTYSKDDLWVISKTLNFDPLDTFIACSVFFGPSSNNDIEISPLKGYSPSNWPSNMVVHALLVCNASTELTSLRNIQEHFNPSSLPIMPHLLTRSSGYEKYERPIKISRGKFKPPAITAKVSTKCNIADHGFVLNLAREMIMQFYLNDDQATALLQIAHMMSSSDEFQGPHAAPISIIHGVFGAGKSYLLAVVVLFLVQLFETHNPPEENSSCHWKLLISSSTNVAVDRVLLGLLDLGFDRFIRVGSIRKIAKPILPHSLHAGSENESEQLRELQALLKEDLTPGEKVYVRKSMELHKLGTNKTLLEQVRVVGATCAACPFPCLSNLKFPVVILDECSQMTEPSSVLPIARFQCEKLILVGDPKQLSPTIQGSEAVHEHGLEQTLFNRLILMGHQAVMLRTQYRCHPSISAIANDLFYEGSLLNGVSDEDRKPLLDWLPTVCFYNANGTEQVEGNNSFYNVEEANFIVKLIQSLIASGIEGSMIGLITLYKSQMNKVCCMLSSATVCDSSDMKAVQVSTVDAFQGAEKEIIILSCVRTRQVGFIDSEKRMNVALTRGKRHLLIVGSLACLTKNKLWEQVIHHCEKQKDGLKHVSQWDERLNSILVLYQKKKEEVEASNSQKNTSKAKVGKS
ncbi:5'-3' DNA helicase ZGRF1 isoform X2 [Engystomops pustulosus]|uniref:5'-3' DNA helicase ZGRF1 isoform X2 n=1 Tax=Engystomops pustulosus TaxID=76066 RepID=UPI003AFA0D69